MLLPSFKGMALLKKSHTYIHQEHNQYLKIYQSFNIRFA